MTLDPAAIADLLTKTGVVGLLVLILVGGAKRVWVWGYQYDEMKSERDRYRAIAEREQQHTGRSIGVAGKLADTIEKREMES